MQFDLSFDLSGIPIRLQLDDAGVASRFATEWRRYLAERTGPALLDVQVQTGGAPAPEGPLQTHATRASWSEGVVRFSSVEGAIEVQASGAAQATLAPAPATRQFWTLVNLICAGLAWRLPSRRALLLHAAAVVLDQRAFLLVGPSGSGKTTWADLARSSGCRYLTDDLALVDASGPTLEVLATPIRADDPQPHPPARWPVAALLLPAHGPVPRLESVLPLAATARVAANLPFIAEWLERDPRIAETLQALTSKVALYRLTFAPDPSFVECLRGVKSSH